MNNPYLPSNHAAGAFVLQRQAQIIRFCRTFCPNFDDFDDYCQDVVARILHKFDALRLDDARNDESVISTWLGWQCRAVRTEHVRRRRRALARFVDNGDSSLSNLATPEHQPGQRRQLTAANTVTRILSTATDQERRAALVVLHGYNTAEAREHLGMSPTDRETGLASLRRRWAVGGIDGQEKRRAG